METIDRTGVEMEAMTACAIAALTIYDMCKSADRSMVIGELALWEKTGGRSGRLASPGRGRSPIRSSTRRPAGHSSTEPDGPSMAPSALEARIDGLLLTEVRASNRTT